MGIIYLFVIRPAIKSNPFNRVFYKINAEYICVIENRDDETIIIWIEKQIKKWYGYNSNRVSWYMLFTVEFNELKNGYQWEFGFDINLLINNHMETLTENVRNIATFNLKSEIDSLYQEYLKSLKSQETKAKLIDNIFNSLDNEKN